MGRVGQVGQNTPAQLFPKPPDQLFIDFFWVGRVGQMGRNPPAQLFTNPPAQLFEKILLTKYFQIVPFLTPILFDCLLQTIPYILPSKFFCSLYQFFKIDQIDHGLCHLFPILPFF